MEYSDGRVKYNQGEGNIAMVKLCRVKCREVEPW